MSSTSSLKTNLTRQELFHEASTAINSSDRDDETKKKMTDGLEILAYPLFGDAETYSFDPSDPSRVGGMVPKTRYTHYLCWKVDDKAVERMNGQAAGLQDSYSVRSTAGVLVTCDQAAMQILYHIDDKRDGSNKFIVTRLDDKHVLIKAAFVEEVKDLLQEELEKNTYVADPNM